MPLNAKERFTALQSGEVDLLSRNTTWTMSRDTSLGLTFAGVMYYDGQGFMVRKSLGVEIGQGARRRQRLRADRHDHRAEPRRLFPTHNMNYKPVVFEQLDEDDAGLRLRPLRCLHDRRLAALSERLRLRQPRRPCRSLPEIISKEPLGPAVRQGDDQWAGIVRWVHFAMLNAEELRRDAGERRRDADVAQSRRSGGCSALEGDFGAGLGLSNDWVVPIIKAVGNYGEIFERNLGSGSRLKIPRGMNALWKDGGLQYAAADPLRGAQ